MCALLWSIADGRGVASSILAGTLLETPASAYGSRGLSRRISVPSGSCIGAYPSSAVIAMRQGRASLAVTSIHDDWPLTTCRTASSVSARVMCCLERPLEDRACCEVATRGGNA